MSDLQSKLGDGLNKLKDGLEQGKHKIQVAQETNNMKRKINEAAKRKTKVLVEMGQRTHYLLRQGEISDPELQKLAHSLIELDQTMYQSGKKITELNQGDAAGTVCSCGFVNSEADKFCRSCGSKLIQPETAPVATGDACPICMEAIASGSRFCGCCGTQVVS